MSLPQALKLKVLETKWLTEKVINITFSVIEPEQGFSYIPGQHITIKVAPDTARQYCIFSDFSDKTKIELMVSAGHEGVGANYLRNLKVGDEIEAIGPLGRRHFREPEKPNLVLVAAGTGISPIISMLLYLRQKGSKSKIRLLLGARKEEDILREEMLDELKNDMDFDYEIFLSQPNENWKGMKGYVTDALTYVEDAQYYIFGVDSMVMDAKAKLEKLGVKEEDIIG